MFMKRVYAIPVSVHIETGCGKLIQLIGFTRSSRRNQHDSLTPSDSMVAWILVYCEGNSMSNQPGGGTIPLQISLIIVCNESIRYESETPQILLGAWHVLIGQRA